MCPLITQAFNQTQVPKTIARCTSTLLQAHQNNQLQMTLNIQVEQTVENSMSVFVNQMQLWGDESVFLYFVDIGKYLTTFQDWVLEMTY